MAIPFCNYLLSLNQIFPDSDLAISKGSLQKAVRVGDISPSELRIRTREHQRPHNHSAGSVLI